MKKSLIALCLVNFEGLENRFGFLSVPEIRLTHEPVRVSLLKQHPRLRLGKSSVAAARRAARKSRNRSKK
ncbi:hypothetical protein [Neisseria elongata]|uniref:hypothetical protein n=1 Tax=Neisseria elongata TaxID=495 RepID=UPI0031FE787C